MKFQDPRNDCSLGHSHFLLKLLSKFVDRFGFFFSISADSYAEVNKKKQQKHSFLLGRIMNLLPWKTTDDTWKHINMMILRDLKWIYCISCKIPAVWWPEKVTILAYTDNICINLSIQNTQIACSILCNKWIWQHNRTSTLKIYVRICNYGRT